MQLGKKILLLVVVLNFYAAASGQATGATGSAVINSDPITHGVQNTGSQHRCNEIPVTPSYIDAVYSTFIAEFFTYVAHTRSQILNTPKGRVPFVEGSDLAQAMNIRPEDYQVIRFYTLQAYDRISENHREADQLNKENGEKIQREGIAMRGNQPIFPVPDPRIEENIKGERQIRFKLKLDLQRGLGFETFNKFDRYVKGRWGNIIFRPDTYDEYIVQCVATGTDSNNSSGGLR